jgi:hypothetical protein
MSVQGGFTPIQAERSKTLSAANLPESPFMNNFSNRRKVPDFSPIFFHFGCNFWVTRVLFEQEGCSDNVFPF